jgi:hypothetical protein
MTTARLVRPQQSAPQLHTRTAQLGDIESAPVIGCLPTAQLDRLAAAIRPCPVIRLSPFDIVAAAPRATDKCLFVDLDAIPRSDLDLVLRSRQASSRASVAYMPVTPANAAVVLRAVAAGFTEVIVPDSHDSAATLVSCVRSCEYRSIIARVLARLAMRLDVMPSGLRAAIVVALAGPSVIRTVRQLCALAGMPRRSVDRWMHRVGIASANRLLAASKLIRLRTAARREHLSLSQAALTTGFSSYEVARRNSRNLLHMPLRSGTLVLSDAAFVAEIVGAVAQNVGSAALGDQCG